MKTYKLTTPIKHGLEEITELNFRKPVARDIKRYTSEELNKFGNVQELAAILSGLPSSVLDQMDAADLVRCGLVIQDFFINSQKISENV